MKRDEIAVAAVIFLFGAITAILSLQMPIGTFRMAGSGMFPLCLGILLTVLSGIFMLRMAFESEETRANKDTSVESSESPIRLVLFFGAMVLAALFFNQLGYLLISFLLMIALLRIIGTKRWGRTIVISAATAVGSYFLFVQWLNIPMPKGWPGL